MYDINLRIKTYHEQNSHDFCIEVVHVVIRLGHGLRRKLLNTWEERSPYLQRQEFGTLHVLGIICHCNSRDRYHLHIFCNF